MILEVAKYIMHEFKSWFLFFLFVFLRPNPPFYETCKDFFLGQASLFLARCDTVIGIFSVTNVKICPKNYVLLNGMYKQEGASSGFQSNLGNQSNLPKTRRWISDPLRRSSENPVDFSF